MIPEIFQGANGIVGARLASEGAGSVLGTGQGGISHGKKKVLDQENAQGSLDWDCCGALLLMGITDSLYPN